MKRWKTLLTGAAMGLAVAASASAQSAYTGKVKLPFDVQWGRAVLTAGEYTLALRSIGQPMRVIDDAGRTRAFVFGSVEPPRAGLPNVLILTSDGRTRTVRSLNCPAWGVDFVYKPFTRAERELVASGLPVEQLPVQVASR